MTNEAVVLEKEEQVTWRVGVEQAVRILCVIGFLITLLLPFIICDALGSVAPVFSQETGIVLSAGEASSQTRFFYDLSYMLQNSGEVFVPLQVFVVGAQWITSSVGAGATFMGALGLIAMALLYVVPVMLFAVLKTSRYVHNTTMDKVRTHVIPICGVLYLFITVMTAIFVIGYRWNFFWEYDKHYDFAFQFFMAYGGLKMLFSMIIGFFITVGCGALTVIYKKGIE